MFISNYQKQIVDIDQLYFPTPWTQENWQDHFNSPDGHLTIRQKEEELLGFACWEYRKWENLHHLYKILILPEYQQEGHGSSLLDQGLKEMRQLHPASEACFLEVESENNAACKMYKNAGFETLGLAKNFYGSGRDALRMTLCFK